MHPPPRLRQALGSLTRAFQRTRLESQRWALAYELVIPQVRRAGGDRRATVPDGEALFASGRAAQPKKGVC